MKLIYETELQKYLRGGKTLEDLKEEYGIKAAYDNEYPKLVCLKYSQIDSPMKEKIVQEARGIILDSQDNWNIVSRPYNKFFNYGENNAAKIDWSTAKLYNKLDGSLMTLYNYKGEWRVQSSGRPDANGEVYNYNGSNITFKELFWQTWKELNYNLPPNYLNEFCYMFELMTPLNKIVVQHAKPKLVLHGCRSVKSGMYYDLQYAVNLSDVNWQMCETYPLTTIEEILESVNNIDPIYQEGYIVVDKEFNRVKIKSPAYVALSHTRDSMSPRNMLKIIATNESEEFLNYFKEYKPLYEKIKNDYFTLVDKIKSTLDNLYELNIEKDYKAVGLYSKNIFYQGALFQLLKRDITIEEYLSNIPIKKLEIWINLAKS